MIEDKKIKHKGKKMSIVVEHDKRRSIILEKALDVFVDEGYEDTTFQKIADRCKITRTTLYIYFKNKREVFNYSIKQFLQILENQITGIRQQKEKSCADKLIKIMTIILERLEENRRLITVVLDFLVHASRGEQDSVNRVRRRTMRLRHIQTSLLIEGKKTGEFSPSINVKDANEMFYGFIEASIFRLAVLRLDSVDELKEAMALAVRRLAND